MHGRREAIGCAPTRPHSPPVAMIWIAAFLKVGLCVGPLVTALMRPKVSTQTSSSGPSRQLELAARTVERHGRKWDCGRNPTEASQRTTTHDCPSPLSTEPGYSERPNRSIRERGGMMPSRKYRVRIAVTAALLAACAPTARAYAQVAPVPGAGNCSPPTIGQGQGSPGGNSHTICQGAGLIYIGPAVGQIATVIGPTVIGPAVIGASNVSAGNGIVVGPGVL